MVLFSSLLSFCLFIDPMDEFPLRAQDPASEELSTYRTNLDSFGFERYRTLIDRYRAGDFQWTVEELASVPIDTVGYLSDQLPRFTDELKELFPEWSVSEADLQAAVLLHTQVAILNSNERERTMQEAHWTAARSICSHIGDKSFRRLWLLALGYFYQNKLEEEPATAVLETALREFPKDPEILLALGTVHESLGDFLGRRSLKRPVGSLTSMSFEEQQHFKWWRRFESDIRQHMKRAQDFYKKALEEDPELVEAHLRLGRVLHYHGKDDDALRRFEWIQKNAPESPHLGMAHLFAGRVHEQEDRIDEALEHYRAAVRAKSDWQLFYVALSHALRRSGDDAESRKVLEQGLRLDIDPRNPQGGLWDYICRRDKFVHLVEQLRSEVLR